MTAKPKPKPTPVAGRREHLERVLEVLWLAFDGDRRLQGREQTTFVESAAPLAREIRATVKELAELAPATEGTKADELRARREARRGKTADPSPAPRRQQARRSNGSHRAG